MEWEAWLSHRPTLLLARIFLGKSGKEDTLGLTLIQISNITTYFMLSSRLPSPGGKDATYKGYSCNLTFPGIPQEHSRAPAQSHLLGSQDAPDYRKGFYEVSLYYWREQSLTPPPLQTLSKKHTKNAAISYWCVWFVFCNFKGAEALHLAMLLVFFIYVCYIWPVPTEPKSLTEYWNYLIKKEVCSLKLVLQALFPYHIPSMLMEYACSPPYGGISLTAKE